MKVFFFLLGLVCSQSVMDKDFKLSKMRDLSDITSMSFDGFENLLITQKGGKLWRLGTSSNELSELYNFDVNTFGESGLLHSLVYNGNIYILLVQQDTRTVVVKGTYVNGVPGNFRTIFRTDREVSCGNHKGGQMRIDNQSNLYVAIGDQCVPSYSQDVQEFYGKVLRMDLEGEPSSWNPYFARGGNARYVYARGFRNPFRMYYDNETDRLYVNDVGQNTQESIYNVKKGENYKYPDNGI